MQRLVEKKQKKVCCNFARINLRLCALVARWKKKEAPQSIRRTTHFM